MQGNSKTDMKSTCLTQTQPLRTQCKLYSTGSRWGSRWTRIGARIGARVGACVGARVGARVGANVGHYKLMLGIISSCWASFARIRGHVGSASIFRYQHVGISNAKSSRWGSKPIQGPNANVIAFWWSIGLKLLKY